MFNEILEKDETNEVSQYFKTQVNLYSEVVDSDLENVFGGKFVEKGNKLLNAEHHVWDNFYKRVFIDVILEQ